MLRADFDFLTSWEPVPGEPGCMQPVAGQAHLDPIETSGQEVISLAETFRHSGWRERRRQVRDALHAAGVSVARETSFAACGAVCRILVSLADPEECRAVSCTCHDRFCLPCGTARSNTIAANVLPLLRKGPCRFVTLTLKHDGQPLAARVARLYESFKLLRKTPFWRKSQRGGVAFLEIKRSRDRQSWHPHFHVLTQGTFLDNVRLSAIWKAITADSFIVDIRFVKDAAGACCYVTKYASKPFDSTLFESKSVLVEAILALHGRRMIITFGNWKGLQATRSPTEAEWRDVGSLADVVFDALAGDLEALRVLFVACGTRAGHLLEVAAIMQEKAKPPPAAPPAFAQLFFDDGFYYKDAAKPGEVRAND